MSLDARFGALRAMLQPGAPPVQATALYALLREARAADAARYDEAWLPYLQAAHARSPLPTLTMTRLREWKLLAALLPEGAPTALELAATSLGDGGVRTLHTALRLTPLRLVSLGLRENDLSGGPLVDLLRSPQVAQLHALDLSHNRRLSLDTFRALADAPHLGALRELDLSETPLHAQQTADVAGISAPVRWIFDGLPALTRLDLSARDLRAQTIAALARMPAPPSLRALGLETAHVYDPLEALEQLWAPGSPWRATLREVCVRAFSTPLDGPIGARSRIPHEDVHAVLDALGAGARKLTTSQSGYGMWVAVTSFDPP